MAAELVSGAGLPALATPNRASEMPMTARAAMSFAMGGAPGLPTHDAGRLLKGASIPAVSRHESVPADTVGDRIDRSRPMHAAILHRLGWQVPALLLLTSLLLPAWPWLSAWFGPWPLWLAA